jgi:hypothetical protein
MKRLVLFLFVFLLIAPLLFGTVSRVQAVPTMYSYDRCETANWIYTGNASATQSAIWGDYAEQYKSLRFNNSYTNSAGDQFVCSNLNSTNIPPWSALPWVFGFWFRLNVGRGNSSEDGYLGVFDSVSGDDLLLHFYWNPGASRYEGEFRADGGSGGGGSTVWIITQGAWYWIEMSYVGDYNGAEMYCYVNGTNVGNRHTYLVHVDNTSSIKLFHSTGGSGNCWGDISLDLVRFDTQQEYPPTNPPFYVDVSFQALDIRTGQNLSIPIYLNGTGYSTPCTISVYPPSTLDVSVIQTWDFNSSHHMSFLNWSDGNTETFRTLSITDFHTYTIYYGLERNWDPGGWINFFIGIVGLILIASSWIMLKIFWNDDEYAKAIGIWLAMLILGFGLTTVLLGG